ncbi:hypothetical protein CSUI_003998 [Cystoisospora suis]|uniref:DnaJ domain-containing protein n=1 Tax=Cystoisospora suis TaxID=483139 RepID=A0A2C6L2R1_9APIC|nr:hypothetical protein CSUI_003998 [Cystoisospora suis]
MPSSTTSSSLSLLLKVSPSSSFFYPRLCGFASIEEQEAFKPVICCSLCIIQRRLESAGKAFFERFELSQISEEDEEQGGGKRGGLSKGKRSTSKKGGDNSKEDEEEKFSSIDEERWKNKRRGGAAGGGRSGGGGGGGSSGFASSARLKRLIGEEKTLYEILGVSEGATADEIKKQYRRLVLEHHPDKAKRRSDLSSSSSARPHTSSPQSNSLQRSSSTTSSSSIPEATSPRAGRGEDKREEDMRRKEGKGSDGAENSGKSVERETPSSSSSFSGDGSTRTQEGEREGASPIVGEGENRKKIEKKNSKEGEEEGEGGGHSYFLKIQEAYEALTDKEFRRQYDSALPFDDTVPSVSAVQRPEEFYTIFAPVFQSNARWSSRRPVPTLGDEETPMEKVRGFYDFWFEFQSWRDFGVHDEYDLNDAECREERRWMERENQKIRKKHIKAERARIQKLVETAYALREAEEEERRQQEEKQRELQEQRRLRDCHKKWRQRARQLHGLYCCGEEKRGKEGVDELQVQELCQKLELKELSGLCYQVYQAAGIEAPTMVEEGRVGDPTPLPEGVCGDDHETCRKVAEVFARRWNEVKEAEKAKEEEQMKENARRQAERKAQEEAKRLARQSSWTPDELSLLAKGLQKFPGGTPRRWKLIADLIGTKTQEEVVEKTKEMSEGASLKAMGSKISQVAFDQFKVHNQGAFKKIEADPDQKDVGDTSTGATQGASGCSRVTENGTSPEWSPAQQMSLEKALAKYPSTMPVNERWSAIAEEVPGKTKKECVERFKQIRAAILAKKKG